MKENTANGEFSLCLSGGRSAQLANGRTLTEADLPGLRGARPGEPVASVNQHPQQLNVYGLKNLSQSTWRAQLSDGSTVEIPPGKNLRLKDGTRVNFGPVDGLIELEQRGGRSIRVAIGVAAVTICIAAGAGWYFYQHRAPSSNDQARIVPNNESVNSEPETRQLPTQTERASPESEKPQAVAPVATPAVLDTTPVAVTRTANATPPTTVTRSKTVMKLPVTRGVYATQDFIEFDCLDGATFDQTKRSLSLFGHWENPERHVWIPYYDYLATALDCKSPTFSLEWTPSSYPMVDKVLKTGGESILNSVSKLFDTDGRLTAGGAWLLQQAGVPVVQFMSQDTTLVRALYTANHPKTAQVVDQLSVWLDSKEGMSDTDLANFCRLLGIDAAYRDFAKQQQPGAVPDDRSMDQFFPKLLAAIGDGLESEGSNYAAQFRQARANGKSSLQAFQDTQLGLTKNFKLLMGKSLDELMSKVVEMAVPPSVIMEATASTVPKVRPVFHDLAPRSLLAQTAFQADVAAKLITCAPQLKRRIPSYKTEFEFAREKAHSGDVGYERFWIAPGKFELSQSRDGNTVRLTSASMVFNARGVNVGPSNSKTDATDPLPIEYAAELTNQYDLLAEQIPILHALRESEKTIAIARWVQKRGFGVKLPTAGRTEWSPPSEIPGIIHVVLSVRNGKVIANSAAEGGIDLRNDPTIHDAVADTPVAEPAATVPIVPDDLAKQEQNVRQRLAQTSTPKDQAALKIELAKLLALKGDIAGSTKELNEAIKLDPNVQGQTDVYKAWAQPHGPGSPPAGPQVPNAPAPAGAGKLTPFQWPAPASLSTLDGPDEVLKAHSGLTDIHVKDLQPFQHHPLLPPPAIPPIPDKLSKDPAVKKELEDFMKTWEQSNQQYGSVARTDTKQADQIKQEVKKHTDEFVDKLKKEHPGDFGLDIQEGSAGPETGAEPNQSEAPQPHE